MIVLVIGGRANGKLSYVKNEFRQLFDTGNVSAADGLVCSVADEFACSIADGLTCSVSDFDKLNIGNHFAGLVRRELASGRSFQDLYELFSEMLQKKAEEKGTWILISDEIGCGVVPVDALDREYREIAGRLLQRAAGLAVRVDRVFCGIGTVIKKTADSDGTV
jgi:adenosylcobinamide kinase/adenosylcobinamide-phosphate guanylyltransferase